MIKQGAVYVDGERVSDIDARLSEDDIKKADGVLLRRGKKNYCRVIMQ
jgi:tyrosyl-tRNA synthetase